MRCLSLGDIYIYIYIVRVYIRSIWFNYSIYICIYAYNIIYHVCKTKGLRNLGGGDSAKNCAVSWDPAISNLYQAKLQSSKQIAKNCIQFNYWCLLINMNHSSFI